MQDQSKSTKFELLDFLFTMSIALGIFPKMFGIETNGFISENWIKMARWPHGKELTDSLTFILGLLTLTFSWYGYYKSINAKAHNSVSGMFRFALDVILVIIYGIILLHYSDFLIVSFWIAVVFTIYVIWDMLKLYEHREAFDNDHNRIYRREQITLKFTCIAWIIYIIQHYNWIPSIILILSSIAMVISYRICKKGTPLKSNIERLIVVFSRHKPVLPLKIYLAGPYTADSDDQLHSNVQRIIDIALSLYKKGHHPYVPHLTHYVDMRAKEIGISMSWDDYMKWDIPWINQCDAFLLVSNSKGASIELQEAKRLKKQIFYSASDIPEIPQS